MAFTPNDPLTRVSVADIEYQLFDPGPDNDNDPATGGVNAQIVMSDGSLEVPGFDLLARLQDDEEGQGHLQNLIALRDYVRSRLNSEYLPS